MIPPTTSFVYTQKHKVIPGYDVIDDIDATLVVYIPAVGRFEPIEALYWVCVLKKKPVVFDVFVKFKAL